ncbi:MAG: divalent metal cation transporter [Methanomassiliicoccales archaeon]
MEELVERRKSVTKARIDSVLSILTGTVLNVVVIAIATILIKGKPVSGFLDIAAPFHDRFGSIGLTLFAIAFACAGISAVVTVGLGSVYNASGFLGYHGRITKRGFRLAFVLALTVAGVASLLPNQIQIMVFTQYLNGALLPFIVIPLMFLTKDKSVMGEHRLGKATLLLASLVSFV